MTDPDAAYYEIDSGASTRELLAVAKLYAREVAERYGLAVDVRALEWEVSKRAKRRAGAVRYRDGEPRTVSLTWKQFQNRGWRATAETVRHELIHVHLLNEAGDASHGERFRDLAEELGTTVHCDRFAEPDWWVVCDDCGERLARYRRSKLVENPGGYRCGECGGRLSVEENATEG